MKRVGTFEDKNRGNYYTSLTRVVNSPTFSAVKYIETEGSITVARKKMREALEKLTSSVEGKNDDVEYLLKYTKCDSA